MNFINQSNFFMRIRIILTSLCLSLCFTLAAQNNGEITGQLIDSISGHPLEYATVALFKHGISQPVNGSVTDGTGHFSFSDLELTDYELVASFLGYAKKTAAKVHLSSAKPKMDVGKISLAPDATQLGEVTVQSLRPMIIQKADRIVVNISGTALAAGNSAYDLLSKAPGVYVDQEGNIQLNGRSGVTVMLNDRLTYLSARDLRNLLEGMSAENVQDIEIITNPSAKYDAEGSSGILNINLKKNALRGLNGNVNASYRYNGKQHGYSVGGRINYKAEDWNSFLNLDMARRVGGRDATFTRVFFGDETTYFDQVAEGNYAVEGPPAVRIGTDYDINKNNSVGVTAYYATNDLESDFLTDTYLGRTPNNPIQYIDANNLSANTFSNFSANLHYVGKLDTLGSNISTDLDYVLIKNRGEANFYNYYDDLTTNEPVMKDFLYTNTPNGFDIYSGKVDYTKAFSSGPKMELGAKASRVISDNDSRFYFNNEEGKILDPNRTNHFLYEENILAAYANLNTKLSEDFTVQAGLRAEHTSSTGESLTTGEINERDYLNLFPSAFVQQQVTENYGINYSYSRRIQRPNYGSLNPFISYRDPYTYVQGNPGLRPQFTHAFGITQLYKKTYSLALNYQLIEDVISELPILVEETATTIYTTGNVDDAQNISLTALAPLKIMKNWDTNNTFILSYNEYNMIVDNMQLKNDQVFYMFQTNHNILLPLNFKMEISGVYRSPQASGLYLVDTMWWVDAGLKRAFLEDKLEVSLNVNDIFGSYRLKFSTDIGENINDFDQDFRTQYVNFSVRYNFSSGLNFKAKNRNNNLEEVDRT